VTVGVHRDLRIVADESAPRPLVAIERELGSLDAAVAPEEQE
jgi:hypothetical protein